jgi:hypothetical protein
MSMPGFNAAVSLYRSKVPYLITGSSAQNDGQVLLALSNSSLGALPAQAATGAPKAGQSGSFSIIPMSQPGHVSNPSSSSGCNDCISSCDNTTYTCLGLTAAVCSACAALSAIPFIGVGLAVGCFEACEAIAASSCLDAGNTCLSNCDNIGSPCCPVACGNNCCLGSETCLDGGQGLCCSAGLLPCPGPQESCYDPTKEKCLPSGVGCPVGQECGYNCCGQYSQCVDPNSGSCCPLLTGIPCGNQCCNGSTQRCTDTGCCPTDQACGGTCCAPGSICVNNQCVVAPSCPSGQFLCVSFDRTKQNCCPAGADCCFDGSCCPGPNNVCCGGRGCIPQWDCYG